MLRVRVGLIEFCDVRFIHPGGTGLRQVCKLDCCRHLLDSLQCCIPERMETLFRNKKLHEWDYESVLPLQSHGFSPGCLSGKLRSGDERFLSDHRLLRLRL